MRCQGKPERVYVTTTRVQMHLARSPAGNPGHNTTDSSAWLEHMPPVVAREFGSVIAHASFPPFFRRQPNCPVGLCRCVHNSLPPLPAPIYEYICGGKPAPDDCNQYLMRFGFFCAVCHSRTGVGRTSVLTPFHLSLPLHRTRFKEAHYWCAPLFDTRPFGEDGPSYPAIP
jgi:hypothetical protein